MMRSNLAAALTATGVFWACTGKIGTPEGNDPGERGPRPRTAEPESPTETSFRFECSDTSAAVSVPLQRLNADQHEAAIREFSRAALGAAADDAVMSRIAAATANLPADQRTPPRGLFHGGYRTHDHRVQQSHVLAYYDTAGSVASILSEHLEVVAGACATDQDPSNDQSCLRGMIDRLAPIAMRRPPTQEEVNILMGSFRNPDGQDADAWADVLSTLLQAPQLVYRVAHGEGEGPRMTDLELASRLALTIWRSPPDQRLIELAERKQLSNDLHAEVERMLEDPRSVEAFRAFAQDWLWLDDLGDPARLVGNQLFDAFLGQDQLPDNYLQVAKEDILGAIEAAFRDYRPLHALWSDETGYVDDAAFDSISTRGPGGGGLLSRPALLISGGASTRPIIRGVFLRTAMLCDEIPPPPADFAGVPEERDSNASSTRELTAELTEVPGSDCAGCHSALINPLGYALESYDSLGRYRTEEALLASGGSIVGTAPVDDVVAPRIDLADLTEVSGPSGLMDLMKNHPKVQACVPRQYLRFASGRYEDVQLDGCVLQAGLEALQEGLGLKSMVKRMVTHPGFAALD